MKTRELKRPGMEEQQQEAKKLDNPELEPSGESVLLLLFQLLVMCALCDPMDFSSTLGS